MIRQFKFRLPVDLQSSFTFPYIIWQENIMERLRCFKSLNIELFGKFLRDTVTGWYARAFHLKLEKVSLMLSSWRHALSIWPRLVDSGDGGERSNSRRKRKYEAEGNTRKCGRKAINVFISKREFFKSARVNASAQVNPWQCPFKQTNFLSHHKDS